MCGLACDIKKFLQLKRAPLNFFDENGNKIYKAEQILEYQNQGRKRPVFCQVSQRFYKDMSVSSRLSMVQKKGKVVQMLCTKAEVDIEVDLASKGVHRALEDMEEALKL